MTSASSMHEARHSKQGLWDNKEGCGSGREGNMYTCGRFMLMYGKNHHNIVKELPHSPNMTLKLIEFSGNWKPQYYEDCISLDMVWSNSG